MKNFDLSEGTVKQIAEDIGIDWATVTYTPLDLIAGMKVELEHGSQDPMTNVTQDDPIITAKIALAHLNEFGDYYVRLEKMERDAEGKDK